MNDKNTLHMNKETARGLAAQAWCTPTNETKEMDTELAEAFADILLRETLQLRKERDEARRLHCHMSAQFMYKSVELDTAKHVANSNGWDCFKEKL